LFPGDWLPEPAEARAPTKLHLRMAVKDVLYRLPLRLGDAWRNRRATAEGRILVVQNSVKQRTVCRDFLGWLERHVPEVRSRLEFGLLPCRVRDWSRYRLMTFWGGDTLVEKAPWLFEAAVALSHECQSHGIPVINSASSWPNVAKSRAAQRMAAAGLRTPRVEPVADVSALWRARDGLSFPLLIREDRCHAQLSVLVTSKGQLERVPWRRFSRPVAAEFIGTRSFVDGLYRKYRYIAVGETGISRHLMFDQAWEVREERVLTDAARAEETLYINSKDPNHEAFQAARRALELDVAAFDYAYDRSGKLVVWEANPFPDINFPENPLSKHIFPAVERTFAALARLYLRRADLPVPKFLDGMLAGVPDGDALDSAAAA